MKKMLFIYNPNSGMGLLKPKLSDVLDIFVKGGYEVTVYPTQKYHDAIRKMAEYGSSMILWHAVEETERWMKLLRG